MTDRALREAVLARQITRVCHATQSRKLAHILTSPEGIKAVDQLLAGEADVLDQNDKLRLDGRLGHICCSIEYPNHYYLQKAKPREPIFRDWVILLIDPSVLWSPGTLFTPRNAAGGSASHIPGIDGFNRLFVSSSVGAGGRTFNRTQQQLASCPTDVQAEALVHGNIPRDLIRAVAVPTLNQAKVEQARLSLMPGAPTDLTWVVSPALFDGSWLNDIRIGRRPREVIVNALESGDSRANND